MTLPGWRARVVAGHAREGAVVSDLPETVSSVLPAVHFRNPEMAYTLAAKSLCVPIESSYIGDTHHVLFFCIRVDGA